MKSDSSEYKEIINKLLQKTRDGRVEWKEEPFSDDSFRSTVGEARDHNRVIAPPNEPDAFCFTIASSETDGSKKLTMRDQNQYQIFQAESNDLPTSSDEEEISNLLEELYQLARRQALKIGHKLEVAATLLDRV